MNFYEAFSMAMKNIRSSKTRSILTMLGIIIGVAAVIVITGLGSGMEKYMREQFESMGTDTLSVYIMGRGSQKMTVDDMQKIVDENSEYLDKMTPSVSFQGSKRVGTEDMNSNVTGVSEDFADIKKLDIAQGRTLQYLDVAQRTNVCVVGSFINLKYFGGQALGEKIKLNGRDFTIVGVLEEKADSTEYSADDAIYVPYSTVSRMMNIRDVDSFTITFKDEEMAAEAKTTLENALTEYFNGSSDAFYVQSMSEVLDMMNQSTNMLITILTLIAGISLVVGGIGIMNIMLVSVTERTKEIGIRKALGAKERYIMSQFVIEAAATSALGGIIGIVVGYILSFVASKVIFITLGEPLTVAPTMFAILVSVGISAAIGIFFGYMPAKKAARLNPIDALRYD
ncbi:MAG: ABC transporter permease [Clostridiales bacterium]|nr:ABC transporter permease [Clostridiales bacterium]